MSDVWNTPSQWYWNLRNQSLEYYSAKMYKNQTEMFSDKREPQIIIPRYALFDLEDFLVSDEGRRFANKQKDFDRKEDVKIINRLCDIVEEFAKK